MGIRLFTMTLVLSSSWAWALRGIPECELALYTYSDDQIAADILSPHHDYSHVHLPRGPRPGGRLAFRALADTVEPALALLEPLSQQHSEDHEIRTARDYARFVRHKQGQSFVFISGYDGRSLPTFDGVVVDHRGQPTMNISLKYSKVKVSHPSLPDLVERMKRRLSLSHGEQHCETPFRWYLAVNNVSDVADRSLVTADYPREIANAARLGALLNLFREDSAPCGREFRTVVDMRHSGYSIDFFHRTEVKAEVLRIVRARAEKNFSLTLLWDAERVVEFSKNYVAIYDPEAP